MRLIRDAKTFANNSNNLIVFLSGLFYQAINFGIHNHKLWFLTVIGKKASCYTGASPFYGNAWSCLGLFCYNYQPRT